MAKLFDSITGKVIAEGDVVLKEKHVYLLFRETEDGHHYDHFFGAPTNYPNAYIWYAWFSYNP